MPWRTTDLVTIRKEFVALALSGQHPVSVLCNAYGISEKTGHKWINRYKEEGGPGLSDRSHVPLNTPHKISLEIRREILALREKHPTWGPKKLRVVLHRRSPQTRWPAASSIGELLRREGCVRPARRTKSALGLPIDTGLTVAKAPNDVWSTDFKGEFRLLNGELCYPLTIQDVFSRFVIGITALGSTAGVPVQIAFTRHFEQYGLPLAIRSDNGVPFASASSIGRLSKLSVWWIRLGIRPERIDVGKPQQNGTHERMHRTLKEETTRPPGASPTDQQRRFDQFGREFNVERPHESLDQETPASRFSVSQRAFPSQLPEMCYPAHFEARVVTQAGQIHFKSRRFQISTALTGQELGLEEIEDDLWSVAFGPLLLGTIHYPSGTFIEEVRWNADDTAPKEEEKQDRRTSKMTEGLPILPV